MKVVWSEDAKARVRECVDYLVEEVGPAFAENWLDGLGERVAALAEQPLIGRIVPEIRQPDVRELFYRRNHRIFYIVKEREDVCIIAGIRHVRQKTTRRNFRR